MSLYSRNYIMTRRGQGIADMRQTTMEMGDLDPDQAVALNIYTINCTHQIGIATSTEVGLTADRYPIKIVILPAVAPLPPDMAETCCSFWKVTTAAGQAIPFQRKPLPATLPIENLYKVTPSFDYALWVHYKGLAPTNLMQDNSPTCAQAVDNLYALCCLDNPTAEQFVQAKALFDQILAACKSENRVPYFKVAENAYVRGIPHGSAHSAVGTMAANKVALMESILCAVVNRARLKSRYPSMEEGTLTLGAYAAASMFRHGLYESYEHKEYYTVGVVQSANESDAYQVVAVQNPPGAANPTGISVGSTFSMKGIKVSPKFVELGNLMVIVSGLMHYLFNHTTGGTVVTGTMLTVLAMYQFMQADFPNEKQVELTSLLYEVLHPSNKRGIANLFFSTAKVYTHGRSSTAPRYEQLVLDSFMQMRTNPHPAGSHKAYICLAALKRVLQAGLAPFLPWADQLNGCINVCRDVLLNGARAHIGSHYYTGEIPTTQSSTIDNYLPELAQFVNTFNKGDSLSMSPHLSEENAKKSAMNWQNLLKDLKAKDISATGAETVKGFLATSGVVHFAIDPTNQETWANAVAQSKSAVDLVAGIIG